MNVLNSIIQSNINTLKTLFSQGNFTRESYILVFIRRVLPEIFLRDIQVGTIILIVSIYDQLS